MVAVLLLLDGEVEDEASDLVILQANALP